MVLDLIGTWLGLGLGGFGTKGLGTGLDNYFPLPVFQVGFEIAMDNQMQIDSNLQAGAGNGHCAAASCGGRGNFECVNQASNITNTSGDYLQIEGAFSLDTRDGGTRGGGRKRERLKDFSFIGLLKIVQMRFVLIITVATLVLALSGTLT